MKKITLLSLMLVFVAGAFAQGVLQKSDEIVKTRLENTLNEKDVKAPVATISYCSQALGANVGAGSVATISAAIQIPAATMGTYTGNFINKIKIGVEPSNLTAVTLKIWSDIATEAGTVIYEQSVDMGTLVSGWNEISLTTPYTIDGSEIYVGYVVESNDYGCHMDDQAPEANGYGDLTFITGISTDWDNVSNLGIEHNWHIEAIVDDGVSFTDVAMTGMSVPNSGCEVSATEFVVTVQNNGSDEITDAFDFMYALNENYAGETAVAVPVPLAVGASVDVPVTMDFSADGSYLIEAYVSYAGDVDDTNDTVSNGVVNTVPTVVDGGTSYTNGFNTNEEFIGLATIDNNDDGSTWNFFLLESGGTDVAAAYQYNASNPADDYLVLNCFDLTAGDYSLSFDYKAQSGDYPESVKAFWGTSADPVDLTNEIVDIPSITNINFENSASTFTIPTDGIYYIAFYAYSAADQYVLWVDNVNISFATDINKLNSNSISVYPNPANNVVTIENAKDAQITIVNMVGQVVASQVANSNRESLNIADLSNGTYVIRIENGNEVSTQKLNIVR